MNWVVSLEGWTTYIFISFREALVVTLQFIGKPLSPRLHFVPASHAYIPPVHVWVVSYAVWSQGTLFQVSVYCVWDQQCHPGPGVGLLRSSLWHPFGGNNACCIGKCSHWKLEHNLWTCCFGVRCSPSWLNGLFGFWVWSQQWGVRYSLPMCLPSGAQGRCYCPGRGYLAWVSIQRRGGRSKGWHRCCMVLLTMSAVRGSVGLDADPWVASDGVALLVCLYKAIGLVNIRCRPCLLYSLGWPQALPVAWCPSQIWICVGQKRGGNTMKDLQRVDHDWLNCTSISMALLELPKIASPFLFWMLAVRLLSSLDKVSLSSSGSIWIRSLFSKGSLSRQSRSSFCTFVLHGLHSSQPRWNNLALTTLGASTGHHHTAIGRIGLVLWAWFNHSTPRQEVRVSLKSSGCAVDWAEFPTFRGPSDSEAQVWSC